MRCESGGRRVLVGMSGGVDSAAAAVLLLDQGYEVEGGTLRLQEDRSAELEAKAVCDTLKIPHHVFDLRNAFEEAVINRFAKSYEAGETPNPCVLCNRSIKFGKMLESALSLGNERIATGHYARVEWDETSGRHLLKKAKDTSKDQTYMLYTLTQEQLCRVVFPLAEYTKASIREIAAARGLANAQKADSQDICFIPDGDYGRFLTDCRGIASEPGQFIDRDGTVLGTHRGILHYTVGQRKGLQLSFDAPRYVLGKDAVTNTVTLGRSEELYTASLHAKDCNFISVPELAAPMEVTVKTRYSQREAAATISPLGNGETKVVFQTPQRAIAKGQAAVFYDGDTVVGGGTIADSE